MRCAIASRPTCSSVVPILDSSLENRRQEEFNNRGAEVRRRVDRRSVGWLCRRGGRRLRVCWQAGAGGRDGGGSGYWASLRSVMSLAIFEAPIIWPLWARMGETLSEIATWRPLL